MRRHSSVPDGMTAPQPEGKELPIEEAKRVLAVFAWLRNSDYFNGNVAKLARTIGVAQPSARAWFEQESLPGYKAALALARWLGVSRDDLLDGTLVPPYRPAGEGTAASNRLRAVVRLRGLLPNEDLEMIARSQPPPYLEQRSELVWVYEILRHYCEPRPDASSSHPPPSATPPTSTTGGDENSFDPKSPRKLNR